MKKLLAVCASLFLSLPAIAEPVVKDYSMDAMGCMILLECANGIKRVTPDYDFGKAQEDYKEEIKRILTALDKLTVGFYIAEERYFPHNTNGIYKPNFNRFFIRKDLLDDKREFIKTLRHEGWHTVQDCMGGGIQTSWIAQVHQDKDIPDFIREMTARVYGLAGQGAAVAWESDANVAKQNSGETATYLEMCTLGSLWERVEPTPLTKEWLIGCGWMKNDGKYKVYTGTKKINECTEGKK
jgi:hypothetical protein